MQITEIREFLEQHIMGAHGYIKKIMKQNYKEINDFVASINERIILGGI